MKPKISFVIAAFNEEKHLAKCIQSCLDQTYPNIEICVTDDGSSDRTWQIMEGFKSENVLISKFDQNKGKVSAFNNSYLMATGDYIAIIGADDVNLLDRISKQMNFLNSHELDLTWGGFIHIDGDDEELPDYKSPLKENPQKLDILQDNFIPGNTILFNRKLAETVFPIPEKFKFEDWWIAFNTIFGFKYKMLPEPAVRYRIHSDNTVGNQSGNYVLLRRKNLIRHIIYHDAFNDELLKDTQFRKYVALNRLVKNYKLICLNDSFVRRFSLLIESVKFFRMGFYKVILKLLFVSLFGLKAVRAIYSLKK